VIPCGSVAVRRASHAHNVRQPVVVHAKAAADLEGPASTKTRKLCYRKDDRAMHPIHGCPENFRDSLTTPTATIPNIFHGLLFGSTL